MSAPTRSSPCWPSTSAARRRSQARPAWKAAEVGADPRRRRSSTWRPPATPRRALYSNPEAYEHYEAVRRLEITDDPSDRRAGAGEAGRRRVPDGARAAPPWSCGRSASSTTAARRTSPRRGPAPQGRRRRCGTWASASRRSSATRRASTCSRTARRASSWCTCTRRRPRSTCTRATTCSRSTPPRRRCAWRRSFGRRAWRAARTASSAACSAASATRRRRARTWSARSSWRATPTTARRSARC